MNQSETCPNCGQEKCNDNLRSDSNPIVCNRCVHVFTIVSEEEPKEFDARIENVRQDVATVSNNYPVWIKAFAVADSIFCLYYLLEKFSVITVIDPRWALFVIVLSSVVLLIWGISRKRPSFTGLFVLVIWIAVLEWLFR